MIPQSYAANRGAFAQGGLSSGEVVRAVRGIRARHPFPLSEHKYSHRRHGAYVPLDVAAHSTSPVFAAMAEELPLESQCRVIEMIVHPYWLSLVAEKSGG